MTATTENVRNQGFLPLACDIPPGVTIAEYRGSRRRRRDRLRSRLWPRRASR
jgi:hypothetical protein